MTTTSSFAPMLAAAALLSAGPASAAFIVQPNGLAASNYSAGTATTDSTLAGSPTLQAPGLTAEVPSVYGGEPYTYSYTPTIDTDNVTTWTSGTVLNGAGGLNSSGLQGGTAGIYNVYHVFPQTGNASGQPALYQVLVDGSTSGVNMLISSQDQNVNDTNSPTSGVGIGLWERIGQATVSDPSQPITVTINTTTSGFVGARTAGVLFEYAGPVPEPALSSLLALGLATIGLRRRRA